MNEICKILDVPFNNVTNTEAVNVLLKFLKEQRCHMVFTPNPEIVMTAQKDKEFMEILKKADLIVPDGIGVVIASKLGKNKLKERVAGYDLVQNLFKNIKDTNNSVYFFGGAPGVAEKAKEEMQKQYKGINIIGTNDGYFDKNKENIIINEIKTLKPDILLVGLGMKKQEEWIYNHKNELPVKICIGTGGCFDVMSKNIKRAPDIFIKLGLEWFYRLLCQPSRFVRMLQLPLFMLFVIKDKFKGE